MMCAAVERFEGFVDKFTGDRIMALFGAPLSRGVRSESEEAESKGRFESNAVLTYGTESPT